MMQKDLLHLSHLIETLSRGLVCATRLRRTWIHERFAAVERSEWLSKDVCDVCWRAELGLKQQSKREEVAGLCP